MPKKISSYQLIFIIVLTLTASTISSIPKILAVSAGVGAWFTVLITAVIVAFFSIFVIKLNVIFMNKTIFEYSRSLLGKMAPYLLSIFYILYFSSILVFMLLSLTNILKTNFLFETPQFVIILLSLCVCGYGAYKGVNNVARLFEIYGVIFIVSVLVAHILMIFQGKFEFIQPFFIKSEIPKYLKAIKSTIFPFLGFELLLIIPINKETKKPVLTVFLSIIGVGLLYIIVVETTIMMIGMNEIRIYQDAMLTAIRLIQLPKIEFLKRLDAIYLIVGLFGLHASTMLIFTVIVEYFSKMFASLKRIYIVIGTGVILFIYTLIAIGINNYLKIYNAIIIYIGLLAAIGIPVFLYIMTKVKKIEKINN